MTLSKERLEFIVANALSEERREMARELLERRERDGQEPVAWRNKRTGKCGSVVIQGKSPSECGYEPLYLAPPAPVVPDEMKRITNEGELIGYEYHGERYGVTVGATWNACRAAMLQSFGNSEQLNSPAVPDGWIKCSERMPDQGGLYLCYVRDEYEFDISHFCFEYLAAHNKFDSAGMNITHWQPLPAAPKQESE